MDGALAPNSVWYSYGTVKIVVDTFKYRSTMQNMPGMKFCISNLLGEAKVPRIKK